MRSSSALVLALVVGACVGTETGNPADTEAELRIELRPTEPTIVPRPKLEQGWLVFGQVALLPAPCDNAGAPSDALAASAAIDLAGTATATLSYTAGDYCGVTVTITPSTTPLPTSAPPELVGRSLWLAGSRADRAPLRIGSAATLEATLAPASSFPLGADVPPVLLALDFEALVAGVDLGAAAPGADGVVIIDADHHPELLEAIEGRLGAALALYRDTDADGTLDADELLAGPLAQGRALADTPDEG